MQILTNPGAALLALVLAAVAHTATAGPVDFGRAELAIALRERGLPARQIEVSVRPGTAAESWSMGPAGVRAADERGAMYALLDAAEQIRRSGKIAAGAGRPATPLRGIRVFLHNKDQEESWYFAREYWDAYFSMLARNRFNRFNLVFAHQTNYLAPPYPFLVELAEFPQIRVPGLADAERARNLAMLCYIAKAAADHGVDFTLSFHTLEGGPSFTIPAAHITARFDVLYYFEVLNREKTGWFYPDPATSTPYFVVETR